MLVLFTLLITINHSFVRSAVTFNSIVGVMDDAASKVCSGGRCTEPLAQVDDTAVPLGQIPEQFAINPVNSINTLIGLENIQSLKQILASIDNADLSSQIRFAATMQRPDMVVELAKHGDQMSLLTAFDEVIQRTKYPKEFFALLLRETKHVSGSNEAQVLFFDHIIRGGFGESSKKFKLIYVLISNADNAEAKKFLIERLSTYDKAVLLLLRAKKGDQEIVRLLAETRDELPFVNALQYFRERGSWEFILSLKPSRPNDVAIALQT